MIDNQINSTTGTLRAKAEFANTAQKLWPGQLVTIKIQTALDRNALAVPRPWCSVAWTRISSYRVKGDKVETVPVQVVYQDSERNILKGIQAGDVLVSDGQSRLKAGAQVEILRKPQ